jgi:hypothetical protein
MRTVNNTSDKPTILKLIHQFHFFFLYVFLYSCFRNGLWFVDPMTEIETRLLRNLTIGFFIWFLGINLFVFIKEYRGSWSRKDYLYPYVLISTLTVIFLLEFFVFDR